jgi:arylsulfatase
MSECVRKFFVQIYKIIANIEITAPNCSGVIFAHGARFGGHSFFIKDKVVAEGLKRTQAWNFYLVGDGLCSGYDSGDAVSKLCKTTGEFKGGIIYFVNVSVDKKHFSLIPDV